MPHRAQQVLLQLRGVWDQWKWSHWTWVQPQPRWAQVVQRTLTQQRTWTQQIWAHRPSQSMVPMVAMGPNPLEKALLKTYNNWREARIVSLNYSTQAGASAMQDAKKCGGSRKILGCRSVLSKKFQDNDGPKCPHYLLWTKDKSGDWKLNLEASTLQHKDFCISGQLVRRAQLIQDPEFVKAQKLDKLSTDKETVKLTLGYNGRLSGSV